MDSYRRIRPSGRGFPAKWKVRGRLPGVCTDRFFPRGKVGRYGRKQLEPKMADALVNECKRLAERMQMAFTMSEPAVFSVELLLDTIKQYLLLYDKCNPRYKEADCKKELWKKIVQDLGVAGKCTAPSS